MVSYLLFGKNNKQIIKKYHGYLGVVWPLLCGLAFVVK